MVPDGQWHAPSRSRSGGSGGRQEVRGRQRNLVETAAGFLGLTPPRPAQLSHPAHTDAAGAGSQAPRQLMEGGGGQGSGGVGVGVGGGTPAGAAAATRPPSLSPDPAHLRHLSSLATATLPTQDDSAVYTFTSSDLITGDPADPASHPPVTGTRPSHRESALMAKLLEGYDPETYPWWDGNDKPSRKVVVKTQLAIQRITDMDLVTGGAGRGFWW